VTVASVESNPDARDAVDAYFSQLFREGGLLQSVVPGFERREGQERLAFAVAGAIESKRHLLAEAPTGSGKGIGYLAPAVFYAAREKRRVVVATANIALQEQLMSKDLPLLSEALPFPFTYSLMKGRNNYLCLARLDELPADGRSEEMDRIVEWADSTTTGDRSELRSEPSPSAWSRVSVGGDDCLGRECHRYEECFSFGANRVAAEANIVVCNYHVLFAHHRLKLLTGEDLVLPEHDVLICDEGHKMTEIARQFFGHTISRYSVGRVLAPLQAAGRKRDAARLAKAADGVFKAAARHARSGDYQTRLRERGEIEVGDLLDALIDAGMSLRSEADRAVGTQLGRRLERAADDARRLHQRLDAARNLRDPNMAYSIDVDPGGRGKIVAQPIDVSRNLRRRIFDETPTVIVTSATLSTEGNFDFVRRELGIDRCCELSVDIPFDFEEQALLVLPENMPTPADPDFGRVVAEVLEEVIEYLDGGTLALFTSYRMLDEVHERLPANGRTILRQGEGPRSRLMDQFKADPRSVLLATQSFWSGVDVPGDSLRAVVIDRLPFPSPGDPVMNAISAQNPAWFNEVSLPRAIIELKQGFGRLIRSRTDRGVVVILDSRLTSKPYGSRILRSLPPVLRTRDLSTRISQMASANR